MIKRTIYFILLGAIIVSGTVSCRSKKHCANFDDPKRNYKNSYNKKGLVKKKGGRTKPSWDN